MRIIDGYRGLGPEARGCSVAIGNFDGVHLGHQALIYDARTFSQGAPVGVVTFEPHPRRFFQPDAPPFRLTPQAEKARILAAHNVDCLFNLTFDAALAGMAAEAFVRDVLVGGLGVSHIAIGADFRFGKGRAGDGALLRAMAETHGFGLSVHDLVGDETGEFASSALRQMLQEGRPQDAARQLGRWHSVSGEVIQGDQRGRELGYPTANLNFGDQLVPRYGIYAAWVEVLDGAQRGRHPGVASIGERPTFGVNAPNFEVHLFDFAGDLYGARISVGLVAFLRGEEAFDSARALIRQMDEDSRQAREALARHPGEGL